MSTNRFNLLFRLKKPRHYTKGNMYVYMRITVGSERVELSIDREFDPLRWNRRSGRAVGTKDDARALNAYLDTMQVKVHEAHREIIASRQTPTAEKLRSKLLGKEVDGPGMLLEIFAEHNGQMEKLIEKEEYAQGTLTHFATTLKHTKSFIKWKFNLKDICVAKVDFSFIRDFEFYLKSQICAHNTTMKYLGDLKKIILLCVKRDWLAKDSFFGYKWREGMFKRSF